MTPRFMSISVLAALLVLAGAGQAQDAAASRDRRIAYVVQHGDARELAGILSKHFKGDAEIQALPDAPSNCLLIRANPAVFAEALKLLEQIDRRPQVIAVELFIAEIMPRKEKDGKPIAKELDGKEFTGPAREVRDKLESLKKNGTLDGLKRIQLTAVADQPASVLVGEMKPIVAGVTTTATGLVSRHITYRHTGTNARITARVSAENMVTLELDLSDARLRVAEDGIELGKDESGKPIRAAEHINVTLKTKLSLRSEQAAAVEGVKTESKSGEAQTLIVATARILEPAAKGSR